MTVEQAVLKKVIEYVEAGRRSIPNYVIEHAHPVHQMSGRARLRGLRKKGLVSYVSMPDNTYEILNDIEELYEAWEKLTGKKWYSELRRRREEKLRQEERVPKEEIVSFRKQMENW